MSKKKGKAEYKQQPSIEQALACHSKGDLLKADLMYRKILKSDPLNGLVLSQRGIIAASRGDFLLAKKLFSEAVAVEPKESMNYFNLGLANRRLGLFAEAEAAYRSSIKYNPKFTEAYFNLGNIAKDRGQYDLAMDCYKRALVLNNQHLSCYCGLSAVYMEMGEYDEALPPLEKALNINPDHVAALVRMGDLYELLSQLDRAEEYVDRALAIEATNAHALRVKATILRRKGLFDKAIKVLLERPVPDEQGLIEMQIHAELGKLFDKANDVDKAYFHFSESNRLMAMSPKGKGTDKYLFLGVLDKISVWLESANHGALSDVEKHEESISPVFMVGFPRSGTTLMDQILDSHPAVRVLEEKPTINTVIERLDSDLGGYPEGLSSLAENEIRDLRDIYSSVVGFELGASSNEELVSKLRGMVLVDKMPLNIVHVGLIMKLFPGARFVLALRHPCDVILSSFMQSFEPNSAMANFYTLEDSINLYVKAMGLWQRYVQEIPVKFHSIKYESLLSNFDREVKGLLDFIGLEWDDSLRNFDTHARARGTIRTPSYSQVTQPIYQTSKYRWLRYKKYFEPYMEKLQPYLEYFSYNE